MSRDASLRAAVHEVFTDEIVHQDRRADASEFEEKFKHQYARDLLEKLEPRILALLASSEERGQGLAGGVAGRFTLAEVADMLEAFRAPRASYFGAPGALSFRDAIRYLRARSEAAAAPTPATRTPPSPAPTVAPESEERP